MKTETQAVLRAAERELSFFRLTWKGTVFTGFLSPILMLLALGVGLGGMMGDRSSLGGLDYLDFLAPGLMVGATAQLGAGVALWPIMAGHRWIGFHRAMVATPIGPQDVAEGYLLWVFVRALAQAVVFLAVAAVVGGISSPWGLIAPIVAALTAIAGTAPLMAYTATRDSDRSFDPIMRVVVTPLYLFSGSFFPSSQLPAGIEAVAQIFPLWHGIELARAATSGLDPAWPIPAHLAVIAVWIVGGIAVARRTFSDRLAP